MAQTGKTSIFTDRSSILSEGLQVPANPIQQQTQFQLPLSPVPDVVGMTPEEMNAFFDKNERLIRRMEQLEARNQELVRILKELQDQKLAEELKRKKMEEEMRRQQEQDEKDVDPT
ncbi:MAG: hypothetical protein EZS28_023918, partial [Streblomastix strix]